MTPAQIAKIMALVDEYLYAPLKQKRAAIEAALRDAPQAEGWVMVPVEPTNEMLECAMKECGGMGCGSCGEYTGIDWDDLRSVYAEMLAAGGKA